jgi:hypothetical protein
MSPRLQTLLHLASVIDLKREKLESALTEARREQLCTQIDILTKQYHTEYAEFIETDQHSEGDVHLSSTRGKVEVHRKGKVILTPVEHIAPTAL